MDYPLQTSKLYLGIVAAVFSIHFSKHPPTLDFFFSRSWKTSPFRAAVDLINMLLTIHSRWLMGLIERLALMLTGVSILIPFIKQFILGSNFLFHHFSVVFRDLFSLLLCPKLSNGTLIQFIDINHTCWEKDIVHINISTCTNHSRFGDVTDWERKTFCCRTKDDDFFPMLLLLQEEVSLSWNSTIWGTVYIDQVFRSLTLKPTVLIVSAYTKDSKYK